MSNRPEYVAPPEIYYNDLEAKKYAMNSRMMDIQTRMSQRALELLSLPASSPPLHLLDIGCGSGLSGEVLTEAGHQWTGLDISPAMLAVALQREVEGDLICHDIGQGLPFRPASFDGCVSVSVIQWLCNADHASHEPKRRLLAFFSSLHAVLRRSAKAVFQLYPSSPAQLSLIMEAATRAGFGGGVVVDFPNSAKAKKFFLCLSVAGAGGELPRALDGEEGAEEAGEEERRTIQVGRVRDAVKAGRKGEKGRLSVKSRDWILSKKERQRRQGKTVIPDTRYTGRKRRPRF